MKKLTPIFVEYMTNADENIVQRSAELMTFMKAQIKTDKNLGQSGGKVDDKGNKTKNNENGNEEQW